MQQRSCVPQLRPDAAKQINTLKKSLNIRPEHFENFPLSKIKYYVMKHWKKSDDKPRQYIKKQQHYFVQEGM